MKNQITEKGFQSYHTGSNELAIEQSATFSSSSVVTLSTLHGYERPLIYGQTFAAMADKTPYPINVNYNATSKEAGLNSYGYAYLMRKFENFVNSDIKLEFYNRLEQTGDPYMVYTGSFASRSDLLTYIAANTTESGVAPGSVAQTVKITASDKLSDHVPQLKKVYGVNQAFYRFRKNYYNKRRPHVDELGLSAHAWQTKADELIAAVWLDTYGVPYPVSPPFTDNDYRTVWISRHYQSMYSIKTDNLSTNHFGESNGRNVADNSSVVTYQQPIYGPVIHNPVVFPTRVVAVGINPGNPVVAWMRNITKASDQYKVHRDYIKGSQPGTALLAFIPIYTTNDNNLKALVCKPYGISEVYVDWFDQAKYDLEAVAHFENDRNLKVLNISSLKSLRGMRQKNSTGPVYITDLSSLFVYPSRQLLHTNRTPIVRFRLREKGTSRVGELSTSYIALEKRAMCWVYVVKND